MSYYSQQHIALSDWIGISHRAFATQAAGNSRPIATRSPVDVFNTDIDRMDSLRDFDFDFDCLEGSAWPEMYGYREFNLPSVASPRRTMPNDTMSTWSMVTPPASSYSEGTLASTSSSEVAEPAGSYNLIDSRSRHHVTHSSASHVNNGIIPSRSTSNHPSCTAQSASSGMFSYNAPPHSFVSNPDFNAAARRPHRPVLHQTTGVAVTADSDLHGPLASMSSSTVPPSRTTSQDFSTSDQSTEAKPDAMTELEDSIKRQKRRQDTTPRFPCDECGQLFARTHNLKVHISAVHNQERKHHCPHEECTRAFSRKHDLTRHLQSKHTEGASPRRKVKVKNE